MTTRNHTHRYYEFNSLTYGIAQSAALAEYLTHIILDGEQPIDMAAVRHHTEPHVTTHT